MGVVQYRIWRGRGWDLQQLTFWGTIIQFDMSQNHATFIESHILRRFNILKKVGSGAYGHVWKVQQKTSKRIFALKKIFDAFQHATDAQRTYRQIQILKQLDHPNIIKLYDTIRADNNKDVYLLFEFMQADLHNVISEGILKDVHIRFIVYQLAKSLKYMHSGSIIHRDLKPSNILVNSNCTIKLCDFGLVRSLQPNTENAAVLTEGVATRWYRAPEVLLGSKSYSTPADIWSFGCIVYEILAQKPLFPGNSTLDQIQKICLFTGYPTEDDINSLESEVSKSMIKQIKLSTNSKSTNYLKDFSPQFSDFLEKIIVFNPTKRLKIDEILNHEIVKAFHKPEEEISCDKVISTSVDDNKKFTVDQYRKLVYGVSVTKSKALSASLGSGVTSAKYLPSAQSNNKTTLIPSSNTPQSKTQQIEKPEIAKKFSHEKLRTNTMQPTYTKIQEPIDAKKFEKPILKYVKSSKQMIKSENTSQLSSTLYKKTEQTKVQDETKEQEHPHKTQEIKKQSQSAYISSKNYYNIKSALDNNNKPEVRQTSNLGSTLANTSWKPIKTNIQTVISPKDMKDKAGMFKSPKYINISKNETGFKAATFYNKIDNNQKPI